MIDYRYLVSLIFFSLLTCVQATAKDSALSLKLADKALSACIKAQADENNWQTIDNVHTLKCHGMNIKNIDGLNTLTQLKTLSLYNNKLTSIDLSVFSQLEHINIASNELQSINLSNLAHLHTLYLFNNNLTRVDFTGLSQLTKLRITNNQLSSLDLSPLQSLEKAYFFDNKLKDLIVKGLPSLKFIDLKQNPMPDEVYDRYDELEGITIIHDGNADDWK